MTVKARAIEVPVEGKNNLARREPGQTVSLARFAMTDVKRDFDTEAVDAGRKFIAKGLVRLANEGADGQIAATVQDGPVRHRVAVAVKAGRDRSTLSSTCTCRESWCSHAAGVALAYLQRFPAARRRTADPVPERLQVVEAVAEVRQLVYGLDLAEDSDALYVTIGLERRRGDEVRVETLSPKRALAQIPPGDTGPDAILCAELLGGTSLPLVAISLDQDELIETLVDTLTASARCKWSPTGRKLTRGPDRRFLSERNPRTGARHFLNLPAKTRIIGADPAWYVEESQGRIGIAEIEEVEANSFGHGSSSASSHNRREERLVIVDGFPLPVLKAVSGRLAAGDEAPGNLDVLILHFEYNGKEISEEETGQFVRIDTDDGPTFVRRNKEDEEAACAVLRDMELSAVRITLEKGKAAARGYAFRTRNAKELWAEFTLTGADDLRRKGWKVEIGTSFQYRVIELSDEWHVDVFENGGGDWFSLDVGIEVEGHRYPLLPILIGILDRGGMSRALGPDGRVKAILDDGRILSLPAERVEKFLTTLQEMLGAGYLMKDGKLRLAAADATGLADLEEILGTRWNGGSRLRALGRRLRAIDRLEKIEVPPTFRAQLRPYQRDGLDWLQFLRVNSMAGILADDMGLGKTAQTLAHIAVEKLAGRLDKPCLIVVPTSLVPNWTAESAKFVPSLRVLVLHGPDRHERKPDVLNTDLVVTTYAILARDTEFLTSLEWHMVVLDEAQAIKNPLAKSTRAACKLNARHRLCLSGTPIENHLGEVWSQFAFLMPGLLGTHRDFAAKFRIPIEKHDDGSKRTQLARRLRPFILRRTKAEVATDLPPKTEIIHRVELESDQRDLYETIRVSMHERVRDEIARLGIARSRIVILDALLKLRQACCDPRLVKLKSARKVTGSGKLEALMEMLVEMIEAGRRILLFSQFTSMLDLIKESLQPTGIKFLELRGDTADRATPVQRFQACEVPLFLISLKAGGRGLNLTAADTVIHYDPWWNPAVEDQATDRAHRIGQNKPVFVYKLIAAGTVEERILELQKRKGSLADAMLDEGTWLGSMAGEDLDFLFGAE